MFPFLFPLGQGHFKGQEEHGTYFPFYLAYRMSIPFSVWTLYPPYLLFMYQLKKVRMPSYHNNGTTKASGLRCMVDHFHG